MSIPIYTGRGAHAQDLFVHALRSSYIAGYRVLDPDYASSKEPDIYEKVRRDPVIAHAIDTRLHAVAGRTWNVTPFSDDPTDKQVAKVVEQGLKQIKRFTEARRDLAAAVVRGMSVGYIEGERRLMSLAGTLPREWWVPTRIKDIDRRRFRLKADWKERQSDNAEFQAVWEMFAVARGRWERIEHPEYFIRVIYNDEEARLGYGRGLLEATYFYKWVKDRILEEGIQGAEKWARGTVVGKMADERFGSANLDDRSNDAIRTAFQDAIADMLKNHNIILGKDDEVQLVESSGTGYQIVQTLINYLDGALITLYCGSKMPFGGGGDTGSNARAETELDVHESLINFDREKIDEDLTESLIGLFCRMNRANFAELGLGGGQMPKFETIQEKREDPEKNARVLNESLNAGLDIRKDEAYKRTGWTMPGPDDEIIQRQAPAANPFGTPFDGDEFEQAIGDKKTAAMARVLMKAGSRPEDAVRCAVEAGKASEPARVAPPPTAPPAPNVVVHSSPVTFHAPAAAPAAAGPSINLGGIHLPDSIKLEALNPQAPIVNVAAAPAPVVNVPAPIVNVAPPQVDVHVAAPNVTVEPAQVTVNPVVEVKMPDFIPFVLPPIKRHTKIETDKDGKITGAVTETIPDAA